jgi:hypothetical protein
MPRILTLRLTRKRALANAGGVTLFFKVDIGRSGRFLSPHQVPEFEGEEAWFECEKVRGRIVVLRQVETPVGARRDA